MAHVMSWLSDVFLIACDVIEGDYVRDEVFVDQSS